MKILGIDPGLQTTGFGIIESEGPRLHYVVSGTIKTKEAAQGDLPNRLRLIYEGVREVVERYEPQQASVEIVFVNVNPQSTLLLGQARGAAIAGHNDAADALGLAICHAHAGHALAQMAKATDLQRRTHAQIKGGRVY